MVFTVERPAFESTVSPSGMSSPWGVAISGSLAYVTDRDADALFILDITDPRNVTVAGSLTDSSNLGQAQEVAVQGDYAFVTANGSNQLTVVDVSTPSSPSIAGSVSVANPQDLVLDATHAYVSAGSAATDDALHVIDITDPENPVEDGVLVDETNLDGAYGVAVDGDHVYVACVLTDSLQVIDVSTKTSPTRAGGVSDGTDLDFARGVALSADGDTAYVAAQRGDRLTVVDVSTPSSPSISGSVTSASELEDAWGVAVVGDVVYVTAFSSDAVTIVDVSTPSSPSIVDSTLGGAALDLPRGIVVSGDLVYVAVDSGSAFTVLDVTETQLSESGTAGHVIGSFVRKSPITGFKWSAFLWIDSAGTGESTELVWGHDSDTALGNGYGFRVRDVSGTLTIELVRYDAGTATVLDSDTTSVPSNEWVQVDVLHETDGSFTVTVDEDGVNVVLTATDATHLTNGRYTHHGIGYHAVGGNAGNAVDAWHQPVYRIADWETGDLSNWSAQASWSVTTASPVSQPVYSLKKGDSGDAMHSEPGEGLDHYPDVGDTHELRVWLENRSLVADGELEVVFGSSFVGSSISQGYGVRVDAGSTLGDGTITLKRYIGGSATTLTSQNLADNIPRETWLTLRIHHATNGDMTVQLFDQTGTQLGSDVTSTNSDGITNGTYDVRHVGFISARGTADAIDAWIISEKA